MGFNSWSEESDSKGLVKIEADCDTVKMEGKTRSTVVLKADVKFKDAVELKQSDHCAAGVEVLKMKDEEDQKDIKMSYLNTKVEFYEGVKPQWPLKGEQGDRKDGFKSDNKSTLSTSRPVDTNMIPGPTSAPCPEDDDFDVNDFPIGPIELFRNDDGATNWDHASDEGRPAEDDRQMQVEQPTLEDVGRPFEGKIHQTTAVKKELRDDLSLLNLRPVKRQRVEFDGVFLPSPAEVRRRWASEEVKPAQANPSHEIAEMNKKVESWRNNGTNRRERLKENGPT